MKHKTNSTYSKANTIDKILQVTQKLHIKRFSFHFLLFGRDENCLVPTE